MKRFRVIIFVLLVAAVTAAVAGCSLFGSDKTETPKEPTVCDLVDCTVTVTGNFVYTGKAQVGEVVVYSSALSKTMAKIDPNIGHEELEVSFSDNIAAGQATVTVKAKSGAKNFKGSAVGHFDIGKGTVAAENYEELKSFCADDNYKSVTIENSVTVPQGDSLVIFEGITLELNADMEIYGTLTNYGVVNLASYHAIYNYGTIDNNRGQILNLHYNAIYSDGVIKNKNGIIQPTFYERTDLNSDTVTVTFDYAEYTGEAITPEFTVKIGKIVVPKGEYTAEFYDNVNAGEGRAVITAIKKSHFLFGSRTENFEIFGGKVEIRNAEELKNVLSDENYTTVDLTAVDGAIGNFTVRNGVTLNIKTDVIISGEVTVDGIMNFVKPTVSPFYRKVEVNGNIIVNGRLANEGTVYLSDGGSITIEESARVTNSGTIYAAGKIDNRGFMLNGGKTFVNSAVENITQGDGAEYCVRTEINARNTLLDLGTGITYDGNLHAPVPVFYNEEVKSGDYEMRYLDIDGNEAILIDGKIKDAGQYLVSVRFPLESKKFYGVFTLPFTIERAKTYFAQDSTFLEAANGGNYEKVIVNGKISGMESFTLSENSVMEISEGAFISSVGTVTVNGTLTIKGKLFANSVVNNGTLINDGKVVTNVLCEGIEGQTAVRIDINNAVLENFENSVKCSLAGTKQSDNVTLTLDNYILAKGIDGDYTIGYTDNTHRGTAHAIFFASEISERVNGSFTKDFTVTRGEAVVNNMAELKTALEHTPDVTNDGTTDYGTVTLGADIVNELAAGRVRLIVNYDVVLDMRGKKLALSDGDELLNAGTIYVDGNMLADISSKCYSGSGKIVGFASVASQVTVLSNFCHEVRLTDNVEVGVKLSFRNAYTNSTYSDDNIFDLCGFGIVYTGSSSSLTVPLTVEVRARNVTVRSSAGKSVIGDNRAKSVAVSLEVGFDTVLTFSAVDIYGYAFTSGEQNASRIAFTGGAQNLG